MKNINIEINSISILLEDTLKRLQITKSQFLNNLIKKNMNYLKTLLKTPKNGELQNEEKQIIDVNYSQIINLSHYEI